MRAARKKGTESKKMEKAKGRMRRLAPNGKSPTLQRNPLNSPGSLRGMTTTRTAKKRKTKAARRVETPAMTRETQRQTCRKPAKGPNHRGERCVFEKPQEGCALGCLLISDLLRTHTVLVVID
uniref:HDGF like 3 n=1 Tax=Myotis myotis TaxID=51298 RepID=A0A7J7R1W0_MYOMY|nr:HDGF like 3 [Myotis myotis]